MEKTWEHSNTHREAGNKARMLLVTYMYFSVCGGVLCEQRKWVFLAELSALPELFV